jgi:hypothetical protein
MGIILSNQAMKDMFPKKYKFDVTKCDKIYDLLVADGQVVAPKDLKIPPLEQRKKRGFANTIIIWDITPHYVPFLGI